VGLSPAYASIVDELSEPTGIGSACGLGASPTPDLRESARAAPTYTQIPPGCTPRLQWGSVVAWSSTAVSTGFVRGHRDPVTTNNRRVRRETHHRCTRMCKRSDLPPVPRSSPAPPQSSNYELDRPGCDTRPLRRDMYFVTSVDKVLLTNTMRAAPPPCPLSDTPACSRALPDPVLGLSLVSWRCLPGTRI
jgi:hypothetical protein